jgi:purine-binding chemotaxis protein CheW
LERTEQLPHQTKAQDLGSKYIVFSIREGKTGKNLDYGVSVDQVQEIGTSEEVTRVPGAPAHIIGVMNLRGKIITIVDMRKFLGIDPGNGSGEKHSSSARIIVAQVGVSMIGLLVDEVDQVLQIYASDIEPAPQVLSQNAPFIMGIAKRNSRLYVLISVKSMFAGDAKSLQGLDISKLSTQQAETQAANATGNQVR